MTTTTRIKNPYIIEGVVTYIPRINGLDKYNRHTITIIPDDQGIFELLEEKRSDLIEYRMTKHNIPDGVEPVKRPWKVIPSHELVGMTFNWNDKNLLDGDMVIVDENDEVFDIQYSDQQLSKARVKASFELWSYAFDDGNGLIYGVKGKLRKLKIIKVADFSDHIHEHHESVNEPADSDF